jgi:dCTP deaminase
MSVLADRDIRAEIESGRIRIAPYDPVDLQPSSVDLHLDRSFRVFRNNRYAFIDPREAQPDLTELLEVRDDEPFILHPGEFVLGQTLEWVELPDDLVARLEGKSSLGRLGLLIHSTAGYVDPGWKGTLTLELSNVANLPIALYAGMRIGQISFFRMSSPVERPYGSSELGSKYQGQSQPTASAFHRDFAARRKLPGGAQAVAAGEPTADDAPGASGTAAGAAPSDPGAAPGPVPSDPREPR